jgi:hypothetical protein
MKDKNEFKSHRVYNFFLMFLSFTKSLNQPQLFCFALYLGYYNTLMLAVLEAKKTQNYKKLIRDVNEKLPKAADIIFFANNSNRLLFSVFGTCI